MYSYRLDAQCCGSGQICYAVFLHVFIACRPSANSAMNAIERRPKPGASSGRVGLHWQRVNDWPARRVLRLWYTLLLLHFGVLQTGAWLCQQLRVLHWACMVGFSACALLGRPLCRHAVLHSGRSPRLVPWGLLQWCLNGIWLRRCCLLCVASLLLLFTSCMFASSAGLDCVRLSYVASRRPLTAPVPSDACFCRAPRATAPPSWRYLRLRPRFGPYCAQWSGATHSLAGRCFAMWPSSL